MEEAYCEPCDYEECPPAQRQREHQLRREAEYNASPPGARRQSSAVDDELLQGWSNYRAKPARLFGSSGISEFGVQRINLPFRAAELDRVAAFLDDEAQSGMGALRPFHRLNAPERLRAWKERFDSLDLGEYDALATPRNPAEAAGAAHLASLCWSVLLIEPNRFFPLHKHPNVEVVYVARGALYENRVLSSALLNRPREECAELLDSGFPRFYRVNKHVGGTPFENPRYSVHQSYTLDEGAVLLVLWNGMHANLTDPDNLIWDPNRCQNPRCPLTCPDKTFEALARNSSRGSRPTASPNDLYDDLSALGMKTGLPSS